MSEVSVTFVGDDGKLMAAIHRQIVAAAKQREGLEGVSKAGEKADASLRRFAEATNRLVATPVERYQTEVRKLDAALKANLITEEIHIRARARAQTELDKATASTTKHVAAQNTAVSVGGKLVGSITSIAAGYLSLDAALSLLNRTYQDHLDLQAKAAENRVLVGKAQQDALKNLTGLPSDVKADILTRQIADVQLRTGFPSRSALTEAAGAGFSASGDIKATLSATEVGASMNLGTPDQLQAFVSGALLTAKGTGIQNAQENASFLLSAGSINLMSDPNKLAAKLGPLIAAGAEMLPRQDRREASREIGALFGTLAREAGDKEGDKTATAQATLMGKLDRFFAVRSDDPGTLFGRLGLIQQDATLRKEFWGDAGFGEEQIKPALQRLITGGSAAATGLAAAKGQVGFGTAGYRQFLSELQMTPEVRTMVADAKLQAALEINRLGGGEALTGQITKIRDAALQQTRRTGIAGMSDTLRENAAYFGEMFTGQDSAQESIQRLEARKYALLRQAAPGLDMMAPVRPSSDPVSNKILSDVRLLQQAIEQIRALVKPPAPPPNQDVAPGTIVPDGRASQGPATGDQASTFGRAATTLLHAASELQRAVADLRGRTTGPLPDFTSRGRREQAAAVG